MAEALMYFARGAEGSIVDVTQVPRGSACGCICLGCRSPVLAKQGKVNAWHFGHVSGASHRACAETALHLAGKELLHELTEILVPKVSGAVTAIDSLTRKHTQTFESAAAPFGFSSCRLEHATGPRRLDALLESADGRRLGIEILVTHKVDEQKAQDLMSLNAPVLEMDLSAWVGKPLDREILKAVLANGAPRVIVAGEHILRAAPASQAKIALEHRLKGVATAVLKVLALQPNEFNVGRRIIERLGLPTVPWPTWLDWTGWLQGQPTDDLPQKLFRTHHRVWQAACVEFVHTHPGGKKFTVQDAVEGVERTICGMHYEEEANFIAISDFLGKHLLSKGLVRFCGNDDHGWGENWYQAEVWTPRKLASALAADSKTNKSEGSVQMGLF